MAPVAILTLAITALGAGGIAAAGCGGGGNLEGSKLPEGVRSGDIAHEACTESGHRVETVDVNNDGKPDIRRVFEDSHEICRITDLNRDGRPEMYEYYDSNGKLRRREADYDDNGVINAVEMYEEGKLVHSELDTTNHGRIDTWDTFEPSTGKRTRRERDVNGDGKVDQWWTFDGDKVSITMDQNGDGKPDPDSTITLGGSNASGPPLPGGGGDAGAAKTASNEPPPPSAPSAPSDPSPLKGDAGVAPPRRGGAKR